MKNKSAVIDLFLVSALSLFVELAFIRWTSTEVRIFAFYKNFALISALLGLGIGFAIERQENPSNWFAKYYLQLFLIVTILALVLGRTPLNNTILLNNVNSQEFVWGAYYPDKQRFFPIAFYVTAITMTVLITMMFIPLGQLTAKKFAPFAPLEGYTINVAGSLAGILVYTLISWLGWPPPVWFLIAGAIAVYYLPRTTTRSLITYSSLALMPVLLTWLWPNVAPRTVWSPYYRIGIEEHHADSDPDVLLGYDLSVNQSWHQAMWNLDPEFVEANYDSEFEHFNALVTDYNLPYQLPNNLGHVLIVGAGTGNDVAGALRNGAQHITAVEIDPVIIDLGKELHPEAPYADPRVTVVNEDARSFFRNDDGRYNLIVFGLLDSHTMFSTASSVRLDNFVYTKESLSDARNLLADDGLMAIAFWVWGGADWVGLRLYRTLTDVFGHEPQAYVLPSGHMLLLVKREPFQEALVDDPLITQRTDYRYREDIEATTDTWPYLYVQDKTIPAPYLIGLTSVALIGMVLTRYALPNFRRVNGHFFFMGAAFFLLETKSITELALLLGSTWIVNAAVIAAILVMIVAANMLVERFKITNCRPYYALLALALLFNLLFPIGNFLSLSDFWQVVLASLAQALPLFFAGIIFAVTFSQTDSIEIALGSNLAGGLLGGISEYSSLVLGSQALYIFALLLYLLSALSLFILSARQTVEG